MVPYVTVLAWMERALPSKRTRLDLDRKSVIYLLESHHIFFPMSQL